jgi:hypothetical protein
MIVGNVIISGHGAFESCTLKVAALRLFHPTVPSILFGAGFYYCDTVSQREELSGSSRKLDTVLKILLNGNIETAISG